MPFSEVQDARLYYEFNAVPGKPVLMLSNSLGTNLSMWEDQVATLTQHFSLLRYDARGHGHSSVPEGPYSIGQMGSDAVGLLDALDLERVHFCGLSMGGMVGIWLGAHAAGRLNRLVLANTAAKVGTVEGWNDRIAAVQKGGMKAIVPAVLQRWFTAEFLVAGARAVVATEAMLAATSPEGYVASCAAIRDMEQRADLGRIVAPTLVVFGSEDPMTTPQDAELLVNGIHAAKDLQLNAAHLSNVEAAEAFTSGVVEFLMA